jgi:hypothetical protein
VVAILSPKSCVQARWALKKDRAACWSLGGPVLYLAVSPVPA